MTNNNKTRQLGRCLVTGGAGFLGRNITKKLLSMGCEVVVLDRVSNGFTHENLTSIKADLLDQDALLKACEGVDCVFHTASIIELGGTDAPQAYRQRSMKINVQGTEAVVAACLQQGVQRLIYTSSNVVCYSGIPITDMNSDTPYAHRVYDMYTESKIAAEKVVLSNNGKQGLLTCALRPSGIYGPESNMMLDKLVAECISGKLVTALGTPNAVHENAYIDNLVHAQILAAERMVAGNRCCGRGYFISDNQPQNYFEFFRPIIEGLGVKFPTFWLPMGTLMPLLKVWQWLHFKAGIPKPFMYPKELDKACTTHISDITEPMRDLDYWPLISATDAMQLCLPYCLELKAKLQGQANISVGESVS